MSYDYENYIEYYRPGFFFDSLKMDLIIGGLLLAAAGGIAGMIFMRRRERKRRQARNFLGFNGGGGIATKSPIVELSKPSKGMPPPVPKKKPPPIPKRYY